MAAINALKIGIVQINTEFSGQVYLPLVAGYLTSFVKAHSIYADKFEFIEPLYKRDSVLKCVEHLAECDVVGFSIYVWNEQLSLKIAESLKKMNPKLIIIFGGPQVPDNAEEYLRKNRFIDICIHNEGEEAFLEVLEKILLKDTFSVANTSILKISESQEYSKIPNRPRMQSLDKIPSPYLNGYFERLMKDNSGQSFLALWESNRGCPFQCTFCDWGSATAMKVNQFDTERLLEEIDWIGGKQIPFVFVCDANFGLLPRDERIAQIVVETKKKYGFPEAFSVQNTKNVKERAFRVQKILSEGGLNNGVTLSMQSLHEPTLEIIKRANISLDSYKELQNRFRAEGILTYSDLILGLPGETLESWISGITTLIKNGQHNRIQFNNLSLLPNAEMNTPEQRNAAGFITANSYIVNVHGSQNEFELDVPEIQELVVGTGTMPKQDWIKARIYAWWVALLYFDKTAQIGLVIFSKDSTLDVGCILESLINHVVENSIDYPILTKINSIFNEHAKDLQDGGLEYIWDSSLLDVYWPADEYAYILIIKNNQVNDFYNEIREAITVIYSSIVDLTILNRFSDALRLNQSLLNQPKIFDNSLLSLSRSEKEILEEFTLILNPDLEIKDFFIEICHPSESNDFESWQRKVVWYGHRSGAYLHNFLKVKKSELGESGKEISGHFS